MSRKVKWLIAGALLIVVAGIALVLTARSLAHRLAQELPGTPKGFVGHKVRFQDATRPETVIKVMTDGILLAESHSDRELRAYDTSFG